MRFLVEYFGGLIFGFVVLVGGLVALPEIGAPELAPGEVGGLALAFIVIAGGFSWYYTANLLAGGDESRRGRGGDPPRR